MSWLLLAAAGAGLAGGTAQAATGFGFALVAVPLLTLAVAPKDAVVVLTATSLLLTAGVAVRDRRHVERALTARITVAALVGMPAGLVALALLPDRVLTIGVAAVAVAFLAWASVGRRVRGGRAAVLAAGVVSGAALTSTGMNGPPLVAVLHGLHLPRLRQRATLQAVFSVQDACAVAGFALAGQLSWADWLLVAAAAPAAAAGWWCGDHLFARIDEHRSRRLVTAVLLATTAVLVARAL